MSETFNTSPAGTIYGTYVDAVAYVDAKFGDAYRAWELLTPENRKRTLLTAAAYLNRQDWISDYETFVARDADQAFKDASYELAVLVASDPDVVLATDQSSAIERVYAGGAGVDFAVPVASSSSTDYALPPVLMALLGDYLAGADPSTAAGYSETGGCVNPFGDCADYDRSEPF